MEKKADLKAKEIRYAKTYKKLALIVGIGALILIFLAIFNKFKPVFINNPSVEQEIIKESSIDVASISTPLLENAENTLPKFAPEEVEDEYNPYEDEIEEIETLDNLQNSKTNLAICNKINEYRVLLAHFTKLSIKLQNEEDVKQDLVIMEKRSYPTEIKELIEELKQYNALITSKKMESEAQEEAQEAAKTFTHEIIEKFIKIREIPKEEPLDKNMKTEMLLKLRMIANYLYSLEFCNEFFAQVIVQ